MPFPKRRSETHATLATLKHFEEISSLVVNPWEFSDPASIRIKHREDGHPDLRQSMAVLAVFIPPFAKARRMGHPKLLCLFEKSKGGVSG